MVKVNLKKLTKNVSCGLYYTRTGLSVSQKFAAEETGISEVQLSNFENEKHLPSLASIIALAELYDVSIDYLVGRCENRHAHKTHKEFVKYKED